MEAAAGRNRGTARLFSAPTTGVSTLVEGLSESASKLHGIEFLEIEVPIAPLDELLSEAGLDGRAIHFCKIDVEGSEADVLAGFDLERWAPWVLVVEATEPTVPIPNHAAWEPIVLDAGYRFCLFDGLNRFYVQPSRAANLAGRLSYPACVFDEPVARIHEASRKTSELEDLNASLSATSQGLRLENDRLLSAAAESRAQAAESRAQLDAIKGTVSWRITRPLRAVRGAAGDVARTPASSLRGGPPVDADRNRSADRDG